MTYSVIGKYASKLQENLKKCFNVADVDEWMEFITKVPGSIIIIIMIINIYIALFFETTQIAVLHIHIKYIIYRHII